MAYAALVSLAQTIDLILNRHQHSISPRVKNQIISLDKYVILLQAFLEDFPDKATSLEGRIREVTHAAENVIEFHMSEQINELSCTWLKSYIVGSSKGNCQHLKKVAEQIESIVEQVMDIKDSVIVKDAQLRDSTTAAASSSSRVAAAAHKDAIVGFGNDELEIKSRLCRESSKLEVVPILGMGGIGKTTLARKIYDDPLIMEFFQIHVWVTVSQDYSVREIVSGLLASMNVSGVEDDSIQDHRVYKNLKRRRYLVVLDDIWSTEAWDDLRMMFPDDGNGSRIMLTTRLSDVAGYVDSSSQVHEMRLMNEKQSWDLLRYKVFKHDSCPDELECVAKMITRSCRGLPLAIVVISGLLSTVDRTKAAWENIAKDVKSAISANDEQFDAILLLSYTRLPHHLRPCLLYTGGFPEDYEMRVSKIIKLWVAEGFLKPNGSNKSSEETAEEYLEDLVKRSIVSVIKRKSNGRIKSFGMHDLMREMCRRKAQEENFILHVSGFLRQGIKLPPRLCIFHNDVKFPENVCDSIIRTVIWLKRDSSWPWHLECFRLLRILDLLDAYDFKLHELSFLPDEVFELIHLRYLACNSLSYIPAAISNLQNLQTIIIGPRIYREYERRFVTSLPGEILRMPQLRHLVGCFTLPSFQEGVALENLQTLSVASNFIWATEILKMIPNLKKLGLTYMGSRNIYKEREESQQLTHQLHNLIYLQHLENLKIEVQSNFTYQERMKRPVFPRTLKKLTLSGMILQLNDMKSVGSLPNLEVLKLIRNTCVGRKWETTEGEFSQLKFLLIKESDLKYWITESSHFPRLKCLVLRFCLYLREIPEDIGEIPTLELIDVNYNPESLLESAKNILEYQRSCGNDALRVTADKSF